MPLLESGQLYTDPTTGTPFLLPGNTLSSDRERWQYRGAVYNMTGQLWDMDLYLNKEGEILGQYMTPAYQDWFYQGMDMWNWYNLEQTQEEMDRMTQETQEEMRLLELDKLREQQEKTAERWKTEDVSIGELVNRFGEISAGWAYVYDPEAERWGVKRSSELSGDEKAYTHQGTDYQEGLEFARNSYQEYQQLVGDISTLIDTQIANERAQALLSGTEYSISDEQIQQMKDEKLASSISEEQAQYIKDIELTYGIDALSQPTEPPASKRTPVTVDSVLAAQEQDNKFMTGSPTNTESLLI